MSEPADSTADSPASGPADHEGAGTPARREILTIIGPTAVGKTAVALLVAAELGGEIVSADSRQVYRGMDVGTAKPAPDERRAVQHHLIDIVEPSETYDAARFAHDAEAAIVRLIDEGREPIVVGGTGFYLTSLFEGLFEGPGRDDRIRRELKARAEAEGPAGLHRALSEVDPVSAERIHPNDAARIVRALEVQMATGRPLSEWQATGTRAPAFSAFYCGLTMDRDVIYERIDDRVDRMIEAGLVDEIRELVRTGRLSPGMPAASAVGYRELLPVVAADGAVPDVSPGDVAEAARFIKRNTRRYAKRQLTWFSALEDVQWIDVEVTSVEGAAAAVVEYWRGRAVGA
jgi:tRNA dimethylallyltransferase